MYNVFNKKDRIEKTHIVSRKTLMFFFLHPFKIHFKQNGEKSVVI